jgi:hypothetical protein
MFPHTVCIEIQDVFTILNLTYLYYFADVMFISKCSFRNPISFITQVHLLLVISFNIQRSTENGQTLVPALGPKGLSSKSQTTIAGLQEQMPSTTFAGKTQK